MGDFLKIHKYLCVLLLAEFCFCIFFLGKAVFTPRQHIQLTAADFSDTGNVKIVSSDGYIGTLGEETEKDTCILKSSYFALPSGAYRVLVKHYSLLDPDHPDEMKNTQIGTIRVREEENSIALHSSGLSLKEDSDESETRFGIRSGGDLRNLYISVSYNGTGSLLINDVDIKESLTYRFTRMIGIVGFFAFLDILLFFFVDNTLIFIDRKQKQIILGLSLIVFVSSISFFADFLLDAHDLGFHLSRIKYLAEAIKEGQFPHRMETIKYTMKQRGRNMQLKVD